MRSRWSWGTRWRTSSDSGPDTVTYDIGLAPATGCVSRRARGRKAWMSACCTPLDRSQTRKPSSAFACSSAPIAVYSRTIYVMSGMDGRHLHKARLLVRHRCGRADHSAVTICFSATATFGPSSCPHCCSTHGLCPSADLSPPCCSRSSKPLSPGRRTVGPPKACPADAEHRPRAIPA